MERIADGCNPVNNVSFVDMESIVAKIKPMYLSIRTGFYMGTEPVQALTLICDYDKSKFYIVSVTLDEVEQLNVPADLEWAMLVAYHRGRMDKIKGTSFYNRYRDMANNKDIIVGSIADDRI